MSSELVIRTVKYETGEHVAFLAHGRLGPPHVESLHFNIVCYRNKGCTVATQRQVMLGLREALSFLREREIDVVQRVAEHRFLSTDELTALMARCRKPRDKKRSAVVSGRYALMRFRVGVAYIKWKAEPIIDRASGSKLRVAALKAQEAFERRVRALEPASRIGDEPVTGDILGLDTAQRALFRKAITPDDPHNPFRPEHQFRIYVPLLLLRELGSRAGELLGAKISDIVYQNGETFIRIVRRPDDPEDTRKVPAVTKTNSRLLQLSPDLARALDVWLTEHRSDLNQYPLARNHAYICVNHKGAALTGAGLRYIFKQIEKRHPSLGRLHPHLLRHTWNDEWVENAERDGIDFERNTRDQKYAMGWSTDSKMPGRYSKRAIRDSTNRRLLKLQASRGE